MALGKNIKIDKVIPEENNASEENEFSLDLTSEIKPEIQKMKPVLENSMIKDELVVLKEENIATSSDEERYAPDDVELEDIKIYYKPSKRKTQKRIMISLEGSFTLKNIHLLKQNIPAIFEHYDFLELKLDNITDVDVSAIQLFHLMRFIYGPQKKFVAIKASFTDAQAKLLNTCGFYEFQTQIKAPN